MIEKFFSDLLACPVCHWGFYQDPGSLVCRNTACGLEYPVLGDIPVLVSDQVSTFSASSYSHLSAEIPGRRGLKTRLRSFVPRISANLVAKKNFGDFKKLLFVSAKCPKVLVLGGAEIGVGMEMILQDDRIQILESDIVIGSRTQVVLDASYIALKSESVDAVVIQAVLEYIPDPAQAVSEIYRVLKPNGLIYSEMPFMQDVHGGRYDFTRLTHLGHLRLFRHFAEIKSGACAGPATALAWSLQHFLLAFVIAPVHRDLVKIFCGFCFFWLKYFDLFLAGTPGGLDGATGTYLLARKSCSLLPDWQLVASYRGAVPATEIL